MNSYYADYNAGTAANRDPAHADVTWISRYETGDVRTQTEQSFAYMKSHQLAFRGAAVWTPPGEEHWHGAGVDCMMSHLRCSKASRTATAPHGLRLSPTSSTKLPTRNAPPRHPDPSTRRVGPLAAIRSWPWWPADSGVCAVGARVARVEWWRGYRGCTA